MLFSHTGVHLLVTFILTAILWGFLPKGKKWVSLFTLLIPLLPAAMYFPVEWLIAQKLWVEYAVFIPVVLFIVFLFFRNKFKKK